MRALSQTGISQHKYAFPIKPSDYTSIWCNRFYFEIRLLTHGESTILPQGAQGRLPAERSLHPEF